MYTEKQLVSFGNYLFTKYGVHVMSDDGTNIPLYIRQVSDADIANALWGHEIDRSLPSAHQIGDIVNISFGEAGNIQSCKVIKVHFSESKVLYDVEVGIPYLDKDQEKTVYTRMYNVDSCFVQTV